MSVNTYDVRLESLLRLVHNMFKKNTNIFRKTMRARRTRARIHGTAARPRLSVFRSLKHISAQVINDDLGLTIASASDSSITEKKSRTEVAVMIGSQVADAAKKAGVTEVIFDRGAYKYHGRVKALAEAVREAGLKF